MGGYRAVEIGRAVRMRDDAQIGEPAIGLCELGIKSGIEQVIGLYDERMTQVYRRIGWSPVPLASSRSRR